MKETVIRFGDDAGLVGILTDPATVHADRPAVLLLNAGLVHRVGPNRLYVKLARSLAEAGHLAFRFDFSGTGDSAPRTDGLPVEDSAVVETRAAMDELARCRQADRFILIAICSGAGFSFRTALSDPRVAGVALINPAAHRWGSEDELSRTLLHHYRRMLSFGASPSKPLRKILSLDFDMGTALDMVRRRLHHLAAEDGCAAATADEYTEGMARLLQRRAHVLLAFSEGDEGLDYYQLYLEARLAPLLQSSFLRVETITGANHTFTMLAHQRRMIERAVGWAATVVPEPDAAAEMAVPIKTKEPAGATPSVVQRKGY
jgi:pimeloyl-ACP methyl ester carboxylesterase